MRLVQSFFSRLKDKMPYKLIGERYVILHLMILLYNSQTNHVGMNQITNSFMLYLSIDNQYFTDEFQALFLQKSDEDAALA